MATGTALAQAIGLLASPILTRLYTPEAFGMFAAFMALVTSATPIITGKYEVAMVLPRLNRNAMELMGVAAWLALLISTLLLIIILIVQPFLLELLDVPGLAGWILLVPVFLLITGMFNLLGYLANRHKLYNIMARSRVINTSAIAACNIFLGIIGVGFIGLIFGNMIGVCLAFAYLCIRQYSVISGITILWSKRRIVLARQYSEYPIYNASSGLLNGVMVNLPIFFLTHYYPIEVVGYYSLVMRVMAAPVSFVSLAVSQVNLTKVVDLISAGSRVEPYIKKLSLGLFAFSAIPVVILILWGPELFSVVFGDNWGKAGHFAQILSFALPAQFVASTLSSTFGATKNNRYGAFWKVFAFICTFSVLGIVGGSGGGVEYFFIALAINNIVLYIFLYYLILKAAKNPKC